MKKVGDRRDGRALYQGHKYRMAMQHVPVHRRLVAVDIGAHVGLWSWQMAKDFKGQVIAFEPHPLHAECWRRNMSDISEEQVGLTLYEKALGASAGTARIQTRTPDSSGDTGVLTLADTGEPWRPDEHQTSMATKVVDQSTDGVDVEMVTLDEMIPETVMVDFIKIDCEGYEKFIVEGAVKTIMRCKPTLIVEQKPETGMEKRYGVGKMDAVLLLKKLGAGVLASKQDDWVMGWR